MTDLRVNQVGRQRRQGAAAAGFTLLELMISIALVLIIILGVNHVFSITSRTIGAANGLADAVRADRMAQYSFSSDAASAVTGDEMPFLIIESQPTSAFLSAAEEAADRDYVRGSPADQVDLRIRSIDNDANNVEGEAGKGEEVARTDLDRKRNFRTDILSLFARGLFRRQTGNDGIYAADMTSNEAWIVYGHVKQPDNSIFNSGNNLNALAGAHNPGWRIGGSNAETAETNPNNFYARQWILGRTCYLLVEPDTSNRIFDRTGTQQRFIRRKTSPTARSMAPLSQGSEVDNASTPEIQWSRYDLVGTSILQYRNHLRDYIPTQQGANWYEDLAYRFAAFPFPDRPLSSQGMARTVPCFLPGCTSFAVEYAGDFVVQEPRDVDEDGDVDNADRTNPRYGRVLSYIPEESDGQIDYFVDRTNANNPVEKIRWYGYPRDINGDGVVWGGISGRDNNDMPDVVPLRDVALTATAGPGGAAAFERFIDPISNRVNFPPAQRDYAAPGALDRDARYICAWGPDTTAHRTPKLLRITLTLDDPTGRLTNGQTYEYIIELP